MDVMHAVNPYTRTRPWVAMIAGTVASGVGVGMVVEAGFGVGPLEAFMDGAAHAADVSMGVTLAVASLALVVIAWLLGLRPGLGTAISVVGISVFIDLTEHLEAPYAVSDWEMWSRIGWYALGFTILIFGVLSLLAAGLGASAYEHAVHAMSKRLGISIGLCLALFDSIALLAAFLLGGPLGVGTVVLVIAFPFLLHHGLPVFNRLIHP